jgi:isocitrate/isopropylmalate dehydrogenase
MFDLYANLRPIKAYPAVPVARPDIDMLFVRENTEDVYKGLEFKIGKHYDLLASYHTKKLRTHRQKSLRNGTSTQWQKESNRHPQSKRHACNRRLIRDVCREVANNTQTSPSTNSTLTQHPCA